MADEGLGHPGMDRLGNQLADLGVATSVTNQGAFALHHDHRVGAYADPVIAGMIRQHDIEVTLLFGNLDQIKSTPYGRMIIGVTGEQAEIDRALAYLRQRDLKVEVIGYVQRHDSTHQ